MLIIILLQLLFLLGYSNITYSQLTISKPKSQDLFYSGDLLHINPETKAEHPIRVKAEKNGKPYQGLRLYAKMVLSPTEKSEIVFCNTQLLTNDKGLAEFYYSVGNESGQYNIVVYGITNEGVYSNFLVYTIYVRDSKWVLMLIFGIIGGLGLFLTGIFLMSEGLQKAFGSKLRTMLTRFTGNPFKSLMTGVVLSTVTQSSSAVSVMLISFVESNLIKFRQSIGVIMGAALATTITVQLVAINITDYALLIIGVGFVLEFLWQNPLIKNIGKSLLGVGLLFLGMYLMSESLTPVKTYQPLFIFLSGMENPFAGILVGTIVTAITQSSSLFIGIIIILGGQGLVSLDAAIPMLIGSNLGTSITAIIASMGKSAYARNVAWAHTIYRAAGVVFIIAWIGPFADIVRSFSPDVNPDNMAVIVPRQIANAHTIFYIIFTLICLPFTSFFANITEKFFPIKEAQQYARLETRFLDKNLISTPSLALNLAKKETTRMIHLCQDMLNDIILPFLTKKKHIINQIAKNEELINYLQQEINKYSLKLVRNNDNDDITKEGFLIMAIAKECEQIADIISVNLLPKASTWICESNEFSDEGKKEIILFQNECQQLLNEVLIAFTEENKEKAKESRKKYKTISTKAMEYDKMHYERLKINHQKSLSSSNTHIELIGLLNAIARHTINMARIIEKN